MSSLKITSLFYPISLLLPIIACKARTFNPSAGIKQQATAEAIGNTSEVPLSRLFKGPLFDAEGVPYLEVVSADIPVFHHTNAVFGTEGAWPYVLKETKRGGDKLAELRKRIKEKALTEDEASAELSATLGAYAGPGLYLAPDPGISSEFGATTVFSCLKKGSRIALDAVDTGPTKQKSLLARPYGTVAYQWYKGMALVMRSSTDLQPESTSVFQFNSFSRMDDLAKWAKNLPDTACAPVKALAEVFKSHDFNPYTFAYSLVGEAARERLAFDHAMAPKVDELTKVWPKSADFDGEIMDFEPASKTSILNCLFSKWEESLAYKQNIYFEDLGFNQKPCPTGKAFAATLAGRTDFKIVPDSDFIATSVRFVPSSELSEAFSAHKKKLSAESPEVQKLIQGYMAHSYYGSLLFSPDLNKFGVNTSPSLADFRKMTKTNSFARIFEFAK